MFRQFLFLITITNRFFHAFNSIKRSIKDLFICEDDVCLKNIFEKN